VRVDPSHGHRETEFDGITQGPFKFWNHRKSFSETVAA
jgi:hypothetical protein